MRLTRGHNLKCCNIFSCEINNLYDRFFTRRYSVQLIGSLA